MNPFPPTMHVAAMVSDLSRSLPYTRLFGAHLVPDDETSPLRRVGRRERELEPR